MPIIKFMRALLFGKTNYEIPNHIFIQQLLIDIEKHIHVKEVIQNGGLLISHSILNQDLNTILNYLKEGNDGGEPEPIKLKSLVAKNFFYELTGLCKGDLKFGIVANSYEIERRQDWKTLDDLIRNDSFLTLPLLGLETLTLSNHLLKRAVTLYDIKCKSLGRLVDPFSFILAPQEDYVDAIHWKTEDSLVQFCRHYPRNLLSIQVKQLLKSTITKFLNGEDVLFDLLSLELKKFIQNINFLNEKIEKVEVNHAPPKLIDLFQRLLAKFKLDYLWLQDTNVTREEEKQDHFITLLFNKNVELERENALLRNIIHSKDI